MIIVHPYISTITIIGQGRLSLCKIQCVTSELPSLKTLSSLLIANVRPYTASATLAYRNIDARHLTNILSGGECI